MINCGAFNDIKLKEDIMATVNVGDLRGGFKVEVEGQPYTVVSNEFVKPGKGNAFNRVKLKHILTGRTIERTFKSGEKVDLADVVETSMRMLYRESDGIVFMDDKTFEQIKIHQEVIGEANKWMMEDRLYDIMFLKGEAVSVEPPIFMEMKITRTDPGDRGNTASGRVMKPATTETGAEVQIPIFVNEAETVKIDTRTGEYVSRVN